MIAQFLGKIHNKKPENKNKLPYRAEIDGLRAIAVVIVILYHAQIVLFGKDYFKGGYIGVDFFFVISGYLISRIIIFEVQEQDSFNFLNFYERRARRILPMLFVVLLISIPFAWQKLIPVDFVEYAKSILTAILFSSNFFFYISTTEYNNMGSLLKPFLHTWSLGVEEQFYLVFPALAVFALQFFKKHFIIILFGLLVSSMLFASFTETKNSELNFFLPISRFWEFVVGSMLAFRDLQEKEKNKGFLIQALPLVGLSLMVYSVSSFDSGTPHPTFQTLIPVMGIALIIGFASKNDIVGKFLGSKPFVWVGLISYSAYLWHFPIFAFARLSSKNPNNHDKLEWISLTLVLSIVSYFLIEKPFRDRNIFSSKAVFFILTLTAILIASLTLYAIKQKGFPQRLPQIFQTDLTEKPWKLNKNEKGQPCYGLYGKLDFCSFGAVDAEKHLFVVGDSNMGSMSNAIISSASLRNYRTTLMNSSACYFIPNSYPINSDGTERVIPNEPCGVDFQNWRLKKLNQSSSNIIVIGGMLDVYLRNNGLNFKSMNQRSIQDNLVHTIKSLANTGTKFVIVYPYPRAPQHMGKYALENLKNTGSDISTLNEKLTEMIYATSYPTKHFIKYSEEAFKLLDQIDSDNVIRVYPHKLFCEDICRFMDSEGLFVVDHNHPSSYMSKSIAKLVFDAIRSRNW